MTDKTFDNAVRSAFVAGVFAKGVFDEQSCEEAFQQWRASYGIGAAPAMGVQQTEDQSGSETVPRPSTEKSCTCRQIKPGVKEVTGCPIHGNIPISLIVW